jgi:hypothetical protein
LYFFFSPGVVCSSSIYGFWSFGNFNYGCPPPKRFNSKGKYIIDDPRYSHHWYEGKYKAKAFRYFYDNSLNFTENSITELSQSLRKEYNENK